MILWWCCLILWWCFSLPLPESLQRTELATSVFSVHQAPSVSLWITQTDSGSAKCGCGSSKTNPFMKSGSTPQNSVKHSQPLLDKSKFVRTVLASCSTYTVPCPTSWHGTLKDVLDPISHTTTNTTNEPDRLSPKCQPNILYRGLIVKAVVQGTHSVNGIRLSLLKSKSIIEELSSEPCAAVLSLRNARSSWSLP